MSGRAASAPRSSLRERRRLRRRRWRIFLAVFIVFILGIVLYGLNQEDVRIKEVHTVGSEAPLDHIALEAMRGSYLGLIPRDSIFFFAGRAIRREVMRQYGDVGAVSLSRKGLQGLTLRVIHRVPIARWCPDHTVADASASTTPDALFENCFYFDDQGLLFATSSTISVAHPFRVYIKLPRQAGSPRGQTLPVATSMPATFDFARAVERHGVSVTTILIEPPEVLYTLQNDTEIRAVLNKEQEAYTLLESARGTLNLSDGSLEYVDLRFDGKVYLKRRDASLAE